MITKDYSSLSLRRQVELLQVNRSSLYYTSNKKSNDTILENEICEIYLKMPFYGYRRIAAELVRRGFVVNEKRVRRIMVDMGLQAIYPKPKTSLRNKEHKIYPYLLRDKIITSPDQVWAADITYIRIQGGFMYLVALIDLHSRYIVGWSLSNTMDANFCATMLEEAITTRRPQIINTDQGSQFTSWLWINILKENGIRISMDGQGRWADNITIERFWRSIKHEHILLHEYDSPKELNKSIGGYIDLYNNYRLHQSLGHKTPAEVYWKR